MLECQLMAVSWLSDCEELVGVPHRRWWGGFRVYSQNPAPYRCSLPTKVSPASSISVSQVATTLSERLK